MLTLRCAQGLRPSGDRGPDDYDVMDGDRSIGRLFLQAHGAWFWTLDFMVTRRMSYGSAESREDAMVAFKAEYDRWLKGGAN
jgi:hypothetical protein